MLRYHYLVLFVPLLLLVVGPALAQAGIKRYVQQQAHPVASIQPGNRDYADLAAFGAAVGEARIVLLGEQDHGDGATMLAKTRLVQYLHEQKGFNVLAFEGDFFALNQGWEQTPPDSATQAAFLHANIYPVWSWCQQCGDLLYHYIPQTYRGAQPLRIAGFDNQFYGAYSQEHLGPVLHAYLSRTRVSFLASPGYSRFFRPFLDTLLNPLHFITGTKDLEGNTGTGRKVAGPFAIARKHEKLRHFTACLDTIGAQLPPATAADDFSRRLLRNLYALAQESAAYTEDTNTTYNVRDAQMADNLNWLVTSKFAGEKIIVWAASLHVAKGQGRDYLLPAEAPASLVAAQDAMHTMGRAFAEDPRIRPQTYTLGIVSGTGTSKRTISPVTTQLPPPRYDSLEKWVPNPFSYAFLDFQPYRTQQAAAGPEYFFMSGLAHSGRYARWSNFFDGIFYVRTMTPCVSNPPAR